MRRILALAATALLVAVPAQLGAQEPRPSLQNSFRLGTGGEALCRVQSSGINPAAATIFDRSYAIVCRDAAEPVGRLFALRTSGGDPADRLARLRASRVACPDQATRVGLDELEGVARTDCRLVDADVGYRVYAFDGGRTLYVAEGLAGYDSVLQLGLRTIVADRIIPGEISIASTGAGDPAAFARVQAGSLDVSQALEEGYRRNNSGSYAEAAEFFSTLLERAQGDPERRQEVGEFLINQALQRSNLRAYAEADVLFAQANAIPTTDPVQLRLRRNFEALHLMNQRRFDEARALLERPLPAVVMERVAEPVISVDAADAINSADPVAQRLTGRRAALTPEERASILDDQALLLRGSIDRIAGNSDRAAATVQAALSGLLSVREGRVTSIARLRSQGLNELAIIAEARGDHSRAESLFREAVTVVATEYPDSVAATAANARLAGFLARRGRTQEALDLYRSIVGRASDKLMANNISGDLLAPYFALLASELPRRPELAGDFFLAGETLVRPGVAGTQAILARELSAGEDEAARLFRQAVTLSRQVEQTRVEIARLQSLEESTPAQAEQLQLLQQELETLQANQTATQARLADFPRYRAVSTQALTLLDLQSALRPGEAYLKMSEAGGAVYMMLVTPDSTSVYRSPLSDETLDQAVTALRETVYVVQNNQVLTYPFDADRARQLYVDLFGPLSTGIASARHLIFEPAGAMLQLPPNLLITEDPAVYRERVAAGGDDFDMRDVAWLGRDHDISTAVSARSFRDIRSTPPSGATREYLGVGQNTPVDPTQPRLWNAGARGGGLGGPDCSWPLSAWNQPISARELVTASSIIGPGRSELLVQDAFTDTALKQKQDLSNYRIVHFATHGLVSAPRPECPAEPALLTSLPTSAGGGPEADGLLTFREIFDLNLDADLIILSACDTAAAASAQITRAAGLTSGGDFALDGLVRAFIGAGGRLVVASHWPVPDDFSATERLISGLFSAPAGTSAAAALRQAQTGLMNQVETSHPYYWSAFAVIGDGSQPVLRAQ